MVEISAFLNEKLPLFQAPFVRIQADFFCLGFGVSMSSEMNDIELSGQAAARAAQGVGFYVCPTDPDGLNSLYYTIEVTDAQGVAFLRRLLTIDVKNIHRGEVRQSFILNALGVITDFVWVAHLPDSDDHFRVVFQSLDTLAWMHQVAKAFDEEFTTLKVATAVLFADQVQTPHGDMPDGKVVTMKTAKGEVLIMRCGRMSLVQGAEGAFEGFTHMGFEIVDDLAAMTLACHAGSPMAFGWVARDQMPSDVNAAQYIDFSDPSRMFIGRALTEARLKAEKTKKCVVVASHQDNAAQWFEDPCTVSLVTEEGVPVATTDQPTLFGEKLIGCFFVPQDVDASKLLWVNEGQDEAYRIEVIK